MWITAIITKIRNGEDLLQTVPIIYRANKFYYLDKALYIYRMNPQSTTHTFKVDEYKALNIVRPALYQCMVDLGYDTYKKIKQNFFKFYLWLLRKKGSSIIAQMLRWMKKILSEIYEYPLTMKSKKDIAI